MANCYECKNITDFKCWVDFGASQTDFDCLKADALNETSVEFVESMEYGADGECNCFELNIVACKCGKNYLKNIYDDVLELCDSCSSKYREEEAKAYTEIESYKCSHCSSEHSSIESLCKCPCQGHQKAY